MTILGDGPTQRMSLAQVTMIIWLMLISIASLINYITLSNLNEQSKNHASNAKLSLLEEKLTEVTKQAADQDQEQPIALSQERYESDQAALDQRFVILQQAFDESPTAIDFLTLQKRIEQLETRPVIVQPPSRVVSRRTPDVPKPDKPPFRVVGIEVRAGERFLSILPTGSTTLVQIQLLRIGETASGWRLDATDGDRAVFQRDDEVYRLEIPPHRQNP